MSTAARVAWLIVGLFLTLPMTYTFGTYVASAGLDQSFGQFAFVAALASCWGGVAIVYCNADPALQGIDAWRSARQSQKTTEQ